MAIGPLGFAAAAAGAAPFPPFLAEWLGDLFPPAAPLNPGGGEGATISRGTGGGTHGCIRPLASALHMLTSRDVSLKQNKSNMDLLYNVPHCAHIKRNYPQCQTPALTSHGNTFVCFII